MNGNDVEAQQRLSLDNNAPVIRRRQVASQRRRDGLLRHAGDQTSQNGEDGILAHLFQVLPLPPEGRPYWCVDVGAWDGKHLSNTFSLLVSSQLGGSSSDRPWHGVLIEADRQRFQDLRALHEPLHNICLNRAVSGNPDSPHSLVNILAQLVEQINFFTQPMDFLCIDIDGPDYWVLHNVLEQGNLRPRVICIEFNPTMPDDLVYIPARDENLRQGASLAALVELTQAYSYTLVETTLFNAFFVQTELYESYLQEEVPDTSIEALHESTMGTSLYQLYDGTIKLWGCKRMLWHRIPQARKMDERKMQMLSTEERNFPFAPADIDELDNATFDLNRAVDLSPYFTASTEGREKTTEALWNQLHRDGFAYVRGLPISANLARQALQMTHQFLQEADENVRRCCLTKDRARRGYSPMCTENFASLLGEAGPNDLVRKFRVGPEASEGDSSCLLQPNIWPPKSSWDPADTFRQRIEDYFHTMASAAQTVVIAICEALLAQHAEFTQVLQPLMQNEALSHTSILTLLGYRTGTRHKGKNKGPLVAPHTDVGVVTILLFDHGDCASLQRRDASGGWVNVDLPKTVPDDPVFVVNVADCLSELTQGMLPSTLHRVATQSGTIPRNGCALFVGLDPGQPLQIDGESMTYEEWRKRRIARAQEVLRQNASSQ